MKKLKDIHLAAFFLLLVMIISCDFNNHETSLSEDDFREQLDQSIPIWMDRYEVPGVSIALINNGEISWSDAYGFADLGKQIRMTAETVCRVESISKSVTARGVMKLVEMEKIGLDDPVYIHLKSWEFPESEYDIERVTIRHLLCHSSGLSLGTIGLEYAPDEEKPSLRESLSREVRFEREPGSKFNYSNVGFHLLELLIEDVTGKDFSEFMEEEILIPLEMVHASFEWSEDFITPVPNGHNLKGEPIQVYVYSEKGAGGLFASAVDIARFVETGMVNEFYSGENILSEDSIRELNSTVIEVSDIYALVSEHYGLGHFIETLPNGQRAVFSGGQGNGWMTHFHLVPETGDGIVILTNSSRSWPLISHILSDWAEWNGFGSVGMGIITKAITGLWMLIGLILAVSLWQMIRIIGDSMQGKRKFDVQIKNYSGVQFVQLGLFLILISVLIWSLTREYLIITSVFPGASGWFLSAILIFAVVMLISALITRVDNTLPKT
ncbi:class C beta-lactamase-related serine hydrolase [Rhodohalobacter sp. SW132]|uniref:serine hydrolase domain-containing protein n=1 Tax=Rhodohalobacter sp. SW132 TaxID=2293433 RepID=UPI000E232B7D|nr:serine hydrolase [Rhodohalobacter sp. SW132]REL37742.1 class C beta-lactamase-related serine hydrolase [Rhodohalobacter sp. SW132]